MKGTIKKIFSSLWFQKQIDNFLEKYEDDNVSSTLTEKQVKAYNSQRYNKKVTKSICMAPFTNMYFSRHGEVFVCCHNRNYSIGSYPIQSIQEIWNSEKAERIRTNLVNNNLSLGCQICQMDINKEFYSEVKANHFDQLSFHSQYPSMMEFELDIICNLECTMCNGEFSSSIRKNREKIAPFVSKYDDQFLNQLEEFIPYLKEARFSGGEPFLIPIYLNIWERIVKLNPNCLISLQTNGTVFNTRIKSILEKGKFEIGISLDSLNEEVFESIRKNAKFETVKKNIEYFSDYCKRKKTPLRFSMCIMQNNWKEMPHYLKFCNQYGAFTSFHKVSQPIELAIRYMNSENLDQIYNYLINYKFDDSFNSFISKQNLNHYYNYVEQIKIWRDKQLENEKVKSVNLDDLKLDFELKLKKNITQNEDIESMVNKFNNLLDLYSQSSQKKLIIELNKSDMPIILQRLYFNTIEQIKEEIKSLYNIHG